MTRNNLSYRNDTDEETLPYLDVMSMVMRRRDGKQSPPCLASRLTPYMTLVAYEIFREHPKVKRVVFYDMEQKGAPNPSDVCSGDALYWLHKSGQMTEEELWTPFDK